MSENITFSPVFAIASSNNSMIFAACQTGLIKSLDGGETWASAYSEDILPLDTTTTWVATSPAFEENQTVFAGIHGAILKSVDTGLTWSITRLALPAPVISKICLSPNFTKDGTLFIATLEDGIFRSTDYGATYTRQNFGLYDTNVLSLHVSPTFAEDHTLFAGTEACLFRSSNAGLSWQELETPDESGAVLSLVSMQDRLVIATEKRGLLESSDNGDSWQVIPETTEMGAISDLLPLSDNLYVLTDMSLLALQKEPFGYTLTPLYNSETPITAARVSTTNPNDVIFGFADGSIRVHQLHVEHSTE